MANHIEFTQELSRPSTRQSLPIGASTTETAVGPPVMSTVRDHDRALSPYCETNAADVGPGFVGSGLDAVSPVVDLHRPSGPVGVPRRSGSTWSAVALD